MLYIVFFDLKFYPGAFFISLQFHSLCSLLWLQRVLQYGYNVIDLNISVLMDPIILYFKRMPSLCGRLQLSFTLSQVLYFWTKRLTLRC